MPNGLENLPVPSGIMPLLPKDVFKDLPSGFRTDMVWLPRLVTKIFLLRSIAMPSGLENLPVPCGITTVCSPCVCDGGFSVCGLGCVVNSVR